MKLGLPIEILQSRLTVKITSKVTSTSAEYATQVIETGSTTLQESLSLGVDFRMRPLAVDVLHQILNDFVLIR